MLLVVSGVFLLGVGGTDCVPYHLYPSGITANSEFSSSYSVDNLNDGRWSTEWATEVGEDYGEVYFDFFNDVDIKHLWMMEGNWYLRDVYVLNSVNITQASVYYNNDPRDYKFYNLWFQEFITDRVTMRFNGTEGNKVTVSEVSFWGCNYTSTAPSSRIPTISPTHRPTVVPTVSPMSPSQMPTITVVPTVAPTVSPSQMPTNSISTILPTMSPRDMPTDSLTPTTLPTMSPTQMPIGSYVSSEKCIIANRVTDLLAVVVFAIVVAVTFMGFQLYRERKMNSEDQVQLLSLYSAARKLGHTDNTYHNEEKAETNTILNMAGQNARSKGKQVNSQGGDICFALDKVSSGGNMSDTRGALEIGSQDSAF